MIGKQEFATSNKLLKEAALYFKERQDDLMISNTYRYMAETQSFSGNYSQAKRYLYYATESLKKIKKCSAYVKTYQNLLNTHLGALLLYKNKVKEAEFYFKEGLEIDDKIGSKSTGLIWNNIGLGLVYEKKGDCSTASTYFTKAKEAILFFDLGKNLEHRYVLLAILKDILSKSKFNLHFD